MLGPGRSQGSEFPAPLHAHLPLRHHLVARVKTNFPTPLSLSARPPAPAAPAKGGPRPGTNLSHKAAEEFPRGVSQELKNLFLKSWFGVGRGGGVVEKEFTMIFFFFFFTSPDGLQKTSVLLFLFIRVALTCSIITLLSTYCASAFPALLPLTASSLVPVTLSFKGFQVSDVEIKKKGEMVGDTVRINAPAFLSFFPFPFLLSSFNLPE